MQRFFFRLQWAEAGNNPLKGLLHAEHVFARMGMPVAGGVVMLTMPVSGHVVLSDGFRRID